MPHCCPYMIAYTWMYPLGGHCLHIGTNAHFTGSWESIPFILTWLHLALYPGVQAQNIFSTNGLGTRLARDMNNMVVSCLGNGWVVPRMSNPIMSNNLYSMHHSTIHLFYYHGVYNPKRWSMPTIYGMAVAL